LPPEVETTAWDRDDRLTRDLHCVQCGYNLRGLPRTGHCGECGAPVEWSLAGGGLSFADPNWLERLRGGAACLTLTFPWLWLLLTWFVFGIGLWRVTTPNPADARGPRLALTALRPLLAAAGPLVWFVILPLCAWYLDDHAAELGLDPAPATIFLAAVGLLALLLITSAALRPIGMRAGSRRLKRWQGRALWLNGMSLALVGAWGVNEAAGLGVDVLTVLGVIGVLAGVVGVVLLFASLVLTWRTLEQAEVRARALREEVRYWQRPVPGSSGARQAGAADAAGAHPSGSAKRAGQ
jgi:hypothetical protein